jgi:signal transduction histidine kinase
VSLACHDLRTPLATAHGFARTLSRTGSLGEAETRYVDMIEQASAEIGELVDALGLLAQIESGRYQPALRPTDPLAIARGARELAGTEGIEVAGESGAPVTVDAPAAERAIAALAVCMQRYGAVDRVHVDVADTRITLEPVKPEAAPVVLADDLRDLGAATARAVLEAFGGSLELAGEKLTVRLPAA